MTMSKVISAMVKVRVSTKPKSVSGPKLLTVMMDLNNYDPFIENTEVL